MVSVLLRSTALVGVPTAATLALGNVATQALVALTPGVVSFDAALQAGAALVATALAGWLTLTVTFSTVSLLRGRCRPRLSPQVVHRVVAVALGLGLTAVAGPAFAVTPLPARPMITVAAAQPGPVTTSLDPGWAAPADPVPAPALTSPAPSASHATPTPSASHATPAPSASYNTPAPSATSSTPAPPTGATDAPATTGWLPSPPPPVPTDPPVTAHRPTQATADQVVVHRGDSLWAIAARHLGPQASDAEIAREWPRWYDANRAVIGDNPDLILPGQVLTAPA